MASVSCARKVLPLVDASPEQSEHDGLLGDPEGALAHERVLLLAQCEREKDDLVALLQVR
jgi:hypothetical protein